MMTFPGHRLGKFYDSLNGVQQGTVPMVLQNPQTTLYRVILAVIGRIIGQAYLDAIVHHKIDDALDELRAPTMILWSVIQVDHQQLNAWCELTSYAFHGRPPATRVPLQSQFWRGAVPWSTWIPS